MRSTMIALAFAIACARLLAPTAMRAQTVSTSQHRAPVIVASKPFGESYLLAAMFAQTPEAHGMTLDRRLGLGKPQNPTYARCPAARAAHPHATGTGGPTSLSVVVGSVRGMRGGMPAPPGPLVAYTPRRMTLSTPCKHYVTPAGSTSRRSTRSI